MRLTHIVCSTFIVIGLIACSDNNTLQLGATTTLEDAGLLPELITAFEKQHDIRIKPVIAGSGQIHQLIKRKDIDTAITHDPEGEQQLLADKRIASRTVFMKNDFILVGPIDDPAHIQHSLTPDEAFKKITHAGSPFVSRNDKSGTHQMEQRWWKTARAQPKEERYIKTNSGMGASLAIAAERNAYTLVDRGTWLNFENKQGLKILFEEPNDLANVYSILSIPENKAAVWENWLRSDAAKQLIVNYRIHNQPVFFTIDSE